MNASTKPELLTAFDAVSVLRLALTQAEHSIKGREHTGFITRALGATEHIGLQAELISRNAATDLTAEELAFVRLVHSNPGCKLNSGECDPKNPDDPYLWIAPQAGEYIEAVGSWKWRITEKGRNAIAEQDATTYLLSSPANAERLAKSMEQLRAGQAQFRELDRSPAQGRIDAIPTWQERAQELGFSGRRQGYPDTDEQEALKAAEIADLRAALADRAARQSAAPGDARDRVRFEFLHSNNKDADGWEWGVAKVRFDNNGKTEFLWGLSDHSDIDALIPSAFNAAPTPSEPVPQRAPETTDKLLTIIANAYQVCGAHDADERILDVLADPEAATGEQVEAMLPYVVAPTATSGGEAGELLANLIEAAAKLREYETYHRAKATADSLAKAEVNADLAGRFEVTIAKARIAPAPKPVPEKYIREIAETAAMAVGKNASVAPQLCFPHIYLTLKAAFAPAATERRTAADETPDLLQETFEFVRPAPTPYPPLDKFDLAAIDKQIAVVDAARHGRLERRLRNDPVELERRSGFDRRARNNPSKT